MPCAGQIGSQLTTPSVYAHSRSRLIRRAPASWVMPSIRPSTKAGTPDSIDFGAGPRRSVGQNSRMRSKLPPMPPLVTITAPARASNSPDRRRGSWQHREWMHRQQAPRRVAPTTAPDSVMSSSTRWRKRSSARPEATASRTLATNGAMTPGPVPQVMWNRGTELPCPVARLPPRSAQPTTGKNDSPRSLEPRALLARGELQVGLGPLARPQVFLAVEGRSAEPVLPRELERVLDAHATLLGGVDEEQAAERPERLAAEIGFGLLLEDRDALARVDEFAGGDEAGYPGADHDRVGLDGVR